mgnify:CR=1 FL=1
MRWKDGCKIDRQTRKTIMGYIQKYDEYKRDCAWGMGTMHKKIVVAAVDRAKELAGQTIGCERARMDIVSAIVLSCINPRVYHFETFAGMIPCERRQFYYYKNEFLNIVNKIMGNDQ